MDTGDIKQIEEIFKHHIGVMSEDFQHKLDIIIEGQQMLGDKLDCVEASLGKSWIASKARGWTLPRTGRTPRPTGRFTE